jgi:large subunit ribosomal protein L3
MKRFHFKGQPATHGTTLSHRSLGSIGQNTSPARVFPGKKMPGRMGGVQRTTQNLLVHRIDTALNLIFVRGCVPGPDDQYISVRDAKKKLVWRAHRAFRRGLPVEAWLKEGVTGLPMPAGTAERVKREGWPEVIEWKGRQIGQ